MLATTPGGFGRPIVALRDVEAFEQIPLRERNLPASTYEMLARGAAMAPDQLALSFFLRAGDFRDPFVWTHAELLADITRTANALRRLGIGRDDVVAFVLPNLPETHFVIWGGEAAGIAFAINPLLEAGQISELLIAGKAKWLVTLAPSPGTDIWQKTSQGRGECAGPAGNSDRQSSPVYPRHRRRSAGGTVAGSECRRPFHPGSQPASGNRRRNAGDRLTFEMPRPGDISSYLLHRRHDRTAQDRRAHPLLGSVRRLVHPSLHWEMRSHRARRSSAACRSSTSMGSW